MTDIFSSEDVKKLLSGKTIVFLGGSIIRGLYKDLVWLLNTNKLIPYKILGSKGEEQFPDLSQVTQNQFLEIFDDDNKDRLHYCGNETCEDDWRGLTSGRSYVEVREYYNEKLDLLIIFKFIKCVWSKDLSEWLHGFAEKHQRHPDILLVGSALWDGNKWGPMGHLEYKENLVKFVKDIPSGCNTFWITTPPISEEVASKGMVAEDQLVFQNYLTRFNIVEMNQIAAQLMRKENVNVIDLGSSFLGQTAPMRRHKDGIHWWPSSNRLMTNKILTYLSLSLNVSLPGRLKSSALDSLCQQFGGGFGASDKTLNENWPSKEELFVWKPKDGFKIDAEVQRISEVEVGWSKVEENITKMKRRVFMHQNQEEYQDNNPDFKSDHPINNFMVTGAGGVQNAQMQHFNGVHDLPSDVHEYHNNPYDLPNTSPGFHNSPLNMPNNGHGFQYSRHNMPNNGQGFYNNPHYMPHNGHGFQYRAHMMPINGHGFHYNPNIMPTIGRGFRNNRQKIRKFLPHNSMYCKDIQNTLASQQHDPVNSRVQDNIAQIFSQNLGPHQRGGRGGRGINRNGRIGIGGRGRGRGQRGGGFVDYDNL